jgi:hypothetical protein
MGFSITLMKTGALMKTGVLGKTAPLIIGGKWRRFRLQTMFTSKIKFGCLKQETLGDGQE